MEGLKAEGYNAGNTISQMQVEVDQSFEWPFRMCNGKQKMKTDKYVCDDKNLFRAGLAQLLCLYALVMLSQFVSFSAIYFVNISADSQLEIVNTAVTW